MSVFWTAYYVWNRDVIILNIQAILINSNNLLWFVFLPILTAPKQTIPVQWSLSDEGEALCTFNLQNFYPKHISSRPMMIKHLMLRVHV